ncbi:MAG: AtzE family amidohydrolase [Bryobacteraceae bacterium]
MTLNQRFSEDAVSIAADVRARRRSAKEVVQAALSRIHEMDAVLNCFTAVTRHIALAEADAVDRKIAAGQDPGPLAGVPFAVKNLLDVAGLTTLAGSKIQAEKPPAVKDATSIARLKEAGAVLVGALNMDEYAYGFTTENTHYGVTRNPHDIERVAGGSSGGSAAAVASGMVPLTLGSDTNGSIRVPSAFCGVFGLKPTFGRISRAGGFLFVESFDHIGPFARSVADIAVAYDTMHGYDASDPVSSKQPRQPLLPEIGTGIDGLRIAVADGYFMQMGSPDVFEPVETVARALGATKTVTIPDVQAARSAAYIITACEGSNRHLPDLRIRPFDFDPVVIERFLAGALIPSAWYLQAQRFRSAYRKKMLKLFESADIILAPSTPCPAIRIGEPTIQVNGVALPSRPNIGIFTQPLSFVGLPILNVPVFRPGTLPLGVQVIAAPNREDLVLRVGAYLEKLGIANAPIAAPHVGVA